jgi:hypothetical protein
MIVMPKSKTHEQEMIAVAARMDAAIKAGAMRAFGGTQVNVDLGNGDYVTVFNDAGSADYSESIFLNNKPLQYGDDYGLSGDEDFDRPETYTNPSDPLDLLDREASELIGEFCGRHQ